MDGERTRQDLVGCGALVIGGTRGIGLATAARLVKRGATVTVSYLHDFAAAEQAVKSLEPLGPKVDVHHSDAADPAACERLFARAHARLGRLDVVVHVAGHMVKKPLGQFTDFEYEDVLAGNARGAFLTLRESARHISDQGRIVLVSSTLTDLTIGEYGVYSGAKAAIEQMVKSAAWELGGRGVTVNAVSPGPVDTPFLRNQETEEALAYVAASVPAGRLGRTDDIAPLISFLASEEARWITAQTIRVNGGMY